MTNKHHGSSFESFLKAEGLLEEVDARARKRVLADQFKAAMKRRRISPAELARRMSTSRSVVYDSLLDPSLGVTLDVLERASTALGLELVVKLVERRPRADKRKRRAA